MADDTELLHQSGRGDHAAFKNLLDRHAPYLFGIAHAMSGNAADAEDLVQETFIAALGAHFRGEASVRTWLVRILTNKVAMFRRGRSRREKHVKFGGDAQAEQSPATTGPTTAAADARMDLTSLLERLSPEHRQVIVLRELEGLSYEEIAAALHVPRGTVESRLHRARDELRKRVRAEKRGETTSP